MKLYLGIDVGSVALKLVVLDSGLQHRYSRYIRIHGQPRETLARALAELRSSLAAESIVAAVSTGTGGRIAAEMIGGEFLNEIVALTKAAGRLTPGVRTLVEMGGADSKLFCFAPAGDGRATLIDFAMNSICAAGTGSFLDQQAGRLKISIEEEFGSLALKSLRPPRIAGRCSVFAKSDMIHLQQIATPDYDIVAGLCLAVARNFKSTVARGKKILPPVGFVGGVAANVGMVRAFEEVLGLAPGELVIPPDHRLFCAYGAALAAATSQAGLRPELHAEGAETPLSVETSLRGRERLEFAFPDSKHYGSTLTLRRPPESQVDGYLGVDIGSLSTNVVVIDRDNQVLSRRYLMTEGRPIEAVRRGLAEVGAELGGSVNIVGCATTGSGRYLIGDFIGADIVRNEITCQAKAASMFDPTVDTIFEIGGQDSKYISLADGVVVDFEMNKACAAGTGSFLQEQAEKLNININEEFGRRALQAKCPVGCGERCTVFMESDLTGYQQSGVEKDDLLAGLAYSIATNYLTRVVGKRKIGQRIFFQGGVAWNQGVVAAFERLLERPITVPPHHDVTGAIGAALLAKERPRPHVSRFRGFDLSTRAYRISTFECEDCSNLCEIRKVEVEGEAPLFYGSRCEKYDAEGRRSESGRFDFFKYREQLMYSSISTRESRGMAQTIGFPRVLFFHEFYPFWASFFRTLGYRVVLSEPTDKKILNFSLENFAAEACFPIKLVFGHVKALLDKHVDYIFLPSILQFREPGAPHENSYMCPYVQSIPYTIRANFAVAGAGAELIMAPVTLELKPVHLRRALEPLRDRFGWPAADFARAIDSACEMQIQFRDALIEKGREWLEQRDLSQPSFCIISRPYNGCDARLSLEIPRKLLQLGVDVVPMEALPLAEEYSHLTDANMYWRFGQRILAAAEIIRRTPNLYPIYITNFGCGPDSFITHFFAERLAGKPFLQLEIDEHSADAGIITRLEAFRDSLSNLRPEERYSVPEIHVHNGNGGNGRPRKVFVPYMSDHAVTFAAALRACGLEAEALPESDAETLHHGREHTSGKECFPCLVTTGDIVRKLKAPDFDRDRSAFFMPAATGPCRFGQYHRYHRRLLDELGYPDVPIISPNSRTGYNDGTFGNGDFSRAAWNSLVATDLLHKVYRRFRPYQRERRTIDKLYQSYLWKLADCVEKRRSLESLLAAALSDFKGLGPLYRAQLPVIGVVGEIFLRANRFSNNFLVERLEDLGAEVWLAPMAEWVYYTNFTYRRRLRGERNFHELLTAKLTDLFQHREEAKLCRVISDEVPAAREAPVEELLGLAAPYLDVSFSGEAILSIGKAVEYVRHGATGIINTLPFNCMPGTIVASISRKVTEDLGGVPWLNLAYEGLSDKAEELKLEAFVHQARQFGGTQQSC